MVEEKKVSPEVKREIDKVMQDKFGGSYEDLRVDNPKERITMKGKYKVIDVDDKEIDLLDLNNGLPIIVEQNEISKNTSLSKEDMITAEIYSDPQDGMTAEWNFLKIEK